MQTPPILTYEVNGRAMYPEPRNMSVAELAALLDQGHTVSVCLEPGDATRYDVLLVPVWGPHVNAAQLGFTTDKTLQRDYLWVINAVPGAPLRGVIIQRGGYYGELLTSGAWRAEWTMILFEWWFEHHLWPRLDALRGVTR